VKGLKGSELETDKRFLRTSKNLDLQTHKIVQNGG